MSYTPPPGGSGGAPTTAPYVTTAADAGLSAEVVLGSGVIMAGVAGSLPAAGIAGRLYYETDTGLLKRDDGAAWAVIAAPTSSGYVVTAADGNLSGESTLAAMIGRGATGSRPAASIAGRLYFDTTTSILYRDNGSSWDSVEGTGAAHTILGGHTDADSADTPADADVLTWNQTAGKWQAAPAPGAGTGAATTLSYLTAQSEASLTNEVVLGSGVIMSGTLASRPAAGVAGRLYAITDAGDRRLTRDNGSSWDTILLYPTGCLVQRLATQSIANNTGAVLISWDTEIRDDASYWTSSPEPTRLTVPAAGWYNYGAVVYWAANNTGARIVDLRINGSTYHGAQSGASSSTMNDLRLTATMQFYLAANDYVEAVVFQNSGGALNLTALMWLIRLA